jgi:PPM family protein phosphatase
MKFSIHQASYIGDRSYNQDRVAYAYGQHALLMVLADGMGGHSHGELAAAIAIETYMNAFARHENNVFADPQGFLTDTMQAAHDQIMQLPHDRDVGFPGTTCVATLIQDDMIYCAYAGDSRLYVLRNRMLVSKTRDHSMVQQWIDWGVMDEEEGRNHPRRNQITNCLGGIEALFYAESCPPQPARSGDYFLLCSDGLWSSLTDADIAIGMNPNCVDTLKTLMDEAYSRENGRSDNITGIAVSWGKTQDDKSTDKIISSILDIA